MKEERLNIIRGMPEISGRSAAIDWLLCCEEVRSWLVEKLEVMGYLERDGATFKGKKLRTFGKLGRPKKINEPLLVDGVFQRMGDREWGWNEVARECEGLMSKSSVIRLLRHELGGSRVLKVNGKLSVNRLVVKG